MNHLVPPPGWPQRARRLSFPPGIDGDGFELYLDRDKQRHEINLRTLEVYSRVGERWAALAWWQLPEEVQVRVWEIRRETPNRQNP